MTKWRGVGRHVLGFRVWSFFGHWLLGTGPYHEVSGPHGLLVRRRDSGGDPVLSAQTQARGAAGVQHVDLAEIPGRNPGQRAVSKAAPQLAAPPAIVDA